VDPADRSEPDDGDPDHARMLAAASAKPGQPIGGFCG
jgi:hypothetical protein